MIALYANPEPMGVAADVETALDRIMAEAAGYQGRADTPQLTRRSVMERTAGRGLNLTGRRPSWKTLAGRLGGGLSGIAALPTSAWAQERP
jgi:hypothetical protein